MRRIIVSSVCFFAAALGAAPTAAAQSTSGYRYLFQMTGAGSDDLHGVTEVLGAAARVDLERQGSDSQYFLVSNAGRTITIVHPETREYSVVDDTTFERLVGSVLHAMPIVDIRVTSSSVTSDALGAGAAIAGHPTTGYRVTQDFTVAVGAFGVTASTIHQRVTTDYWIATDLTLPHNPLITLLSQVETVLAQTDRTFAHKTEQALRPFATGTPLKILVRSETTGDDGKTDAKTQVLEVSSVTRATVDPRRLALPAGFTRKEPGMNIKF